MVPKDHNWREPRIDPEQPWSSLCCEQSLSALGAGVIRYGAVSSSGFGDGAYEAFPQRDAEGNIVAVRIVFQTSEDLLDPETMEPGLR